MNENAEYDVFRAPRQVLPLAIERVTEIIADARDDEGITDAEIQNAWCAIDYGRGTLCAHGLQPVRGELLDEILYRALKQGLNAQYKLYCTDMSAAEEFATTSQRCGRIGL